MLTEQELKDLYGKTYVEAFGAQQSQQRLARLVPLMKLQLIDHVVDFACGNGMLLPMVAGRVQSYTGVDFSQDFIAAAQARQAASGVTGAYFVCADIIDFCAENPAKFDVAFAMDFSEHVYDEAWVMLLQAIKTSLKPGGRLYLHTPNATFFLEQMKARNFIVKQFPEHIAVRTLEHNVRLVEKSGFHARAVHLLPHYNILRFLHGLSGLPWVGKYFQARIFMEAVLPC